MNALVEIGLSNAVQAAVLAPAAAVVGWCLRRRPAVVHALWILVLLKLVTPSFVRVDVPWTASEGEVPPTTVAALPSGVPTVETPPPPATPLEPARTAAPTTFSWQPLVAAVWLGGAVVWWGLALSRLLRLRRLLRAGFTEPQLRQRVARLAERFGLHSAPEVWTVAARISPMLWAPGGKSRLLLPADLWDELTIEQQDAVLAHELAHLRRGDPWVRRLELLVGGLYWWHPAVWWARREIEAAEEQCCDAWVAWALPDSGQAYATALLSTVSYLSGRRPPLPAGASGVGHVRTLKRRLAMIVNGTTTGATARALPRIVLLTGVVGLLWLPTWAHGDPQDKSRGNAPKVERLPSPVVKAAPPAGEPPAPRPVPPKPQGPLPPEFVGSVYAARRLDVTPAVAGQVVKVAVESGATVKRGDLLAELDPRQAQLEVQRATAKLLVAKAQAERARIAADALNSKSEIPIVEANLKLAETEVDLARRALDATRIVAPMDGTVLQWRVQVGQNVRVGQSLGELADLRRMMAVVMLPPREVGRLEVGRDCRIKVEATGEVYHGVVAQIGHVVDSTTGTVNVSVTIEPPEKGDPPRPGSIVRVEFAGKTPPPPPPPPPVP